MSAPRYYMKTDDPKVLKDVDDLKALSVRRYNFFIAKAREWGFEHIAFEDFSEPYYFFKEATKDGPLTGPKVEGFKGGDPYWQDGKRYWKYSFHGRNKTASAMMKELKAAEPIPPELQGSYHRRSNLAAVFCARYGLPDGVFSGNCISYGVVARLTHQNILVCSIPFCDDEGSREKALPVFPEGFTEITEREMHELIKEHNDSLKGEDGE